MTVAHLTYYLKRDSRELTLHRYFGCAVCFLSQWLNQIHLCNVVVNWY